MREDYEGFDPIGDPAGFALSAAAVAYGLAWLALESVRERGLGPFRRLLRCA